MKRDAVAMTLLFDYYGALLTQKQQELFDQYYNQDLSLAEIAENEGISRQGVHDAIARAEALLLEFEQKTGCMARGRRVTQALQTGSGAVSLRGKAHDGRWLVVIGADSAGRTTTYGLIDADQFAAGSTDWQPVAMWQG